MKLYNTIVVWDVYTVAESPEAAREAANTFIRDGLPCSEQVALEVRASKQIRRAWVDETPLVAGDVSDEDFRKLRGKTISQTFSMLYEKNPKD